MAFSMLKIRRPLGRLIFNMGIAIPGKPSFLLRRPPGLFSHKYSQKTPHNSPVRVRYGVSFAEPASYWYSASVSVIIYVISYNIGWRYYSTRLYLDHIDWLEQERHNSSALAMELCLSCTKPSTYGLDIRSDIRIGNRFYIKRMIFTKF